MLHHERACWRQGWTGVAGVDEAGRGPLAGSVVAACVILPKRPGKSLDGLTDSKQLTEAQRERYFAAIQTRAIAIGVGTASAAEIDAINILQATFLAMKRAIAQVAEASALDYLLIDGNKTVPGLATPQLAIVKGDANSLSIAAASVIAKVTRDREMVELAERFPEYGFERHKGYGTALHYQALSAHGPCPEHRRSFLRGLEQGRML